MDGVPLAFALHFQIFQTKLGFSKLSLDVDLL